jgi:type IV pilus biogenesis protein CpaD/CtpE
VSRKRWMIGVACRCALLVALTAPVPTLAFASTASAASSPDCMRTPLPTDCVTAIKFVAPSTIGYTTSAEDALSASWSPLAAGTTEGLSAPVPADEARVRAAAEASAHGLAFTAAAGVGHRRARTAQYSAVCVSTAYRPTIVHISGTTYHMHARSTQSCFGVDEHFIYTAIYRANVNRAADSAYGFSGQGIGTDAWRTCYDLGDAHTWWNYSDFYAIVDNEIVQGPVGFFEPVSHHCT